MPMHEWSISGRIYLKLFPHSWGRDRGFSLYFTTFCCILSFFLPSFLSFFPSFFLSSFLLSLYTHPHPHTFMYIYVIDTHKHTHIHDANANKHYTYNYKKRYGSVKEGVSTFWLNLYCESLYWCYYFTIFPLSLSVNKVLLNHLKVSYRYYNSPLNTTTCISS